MKFVKFGTGYIRASCIESLRVVPRPGKFALLLFIATTEGAYEESFASEEAAQARLDELIAILNNEPHQDAPAKFYYGNDLEACF